MAKEMNRPAGNGGVTSGVVIAGHFNEPDTYMTRRPDGMEDWLITYTLGGTGYYITSGTKSLCRAGDIALLKSGTPHQYGTEKGERWHFVWAHFSSRMLETGLLPDKELIVHRVESDSVRKRIYRAFKRVISDFGERGPYWHELSENALREILLLLAKRMSGPTDPRIEEALRLLSENMRDSVRIDVLARAVGLSPSRLSHLFKETTGHSIVETLNRMRIRQAALLLRHTDRNASEVAQDVGFGNYNHFLNQFRKQFGVNPSTFQRRGYGTERE
ncbi:helix-turn-helix domain-containing protein [Paenibacillus mesophilus]|uniref:helix-turn-helix domain-containing protein n=1 Tax=Paenibacillus mesophilus TaxID=2582849 RepID=UPI00110E3337|nr:helix-turn-helix domain-containing protein [Paenibacillus mesophilus]TMV48403.1 helix-turn-helix domain-containing protein [Paenibacillus mesophilus]